MIVNDIKYVMDDCNGYIDYVVEDCNPAGIVYTINSKTEIL